MQLNNQRGIHLPTIGLASYKLFKLKNQEPSYFGTLKKNKAEIPVAFKPNKHRTQGPAVYGYMTLLSYVSKPCKAVYGSRPYITQNKKTQKLRSLI